MPAENDPLTGLRRLHRLAVERYASIPGYSAQVHQREQVGGINKPEELMLFKFRKSPWSVYFKWVGNAGHGREVVYVPGRYKDEIHTLLAAGDVFWKPAGSRFAISPDNILTRGRSRHPITEAGIGSLLDRFSLILDAQSKGDRHLGMLSALGPQGRPEFATPVETVEQVIPPGAEAALPRGGRRLWFFGADSHLPELISTRDEKGQEVEYYWYERLEYPQQFTDADFDPDQLWGKR
jgi:hypothetical protein